MMPLLTSILAGLGRDAIKKGVQGLNRGLFTSEFEAKLRDAVIAWAHGLPQGAELAHPNAILRPDPSSPPSGEVAEKLSSGLVPTADDWHVLLMQHWDHVRDNQIETQPFFQLDQAKASAHLQDLARVLHRVAAEDPKRFNVQALSDISSVRKELAQFGQVVRREADSATLQSTSDFHARIENACSYTANGQPDIAIAELVKLRSSSWERLSPREQYRVVANLGIAYDAKNERDTAAHHYIECRQYLRDDEKARCWEAIGISHSDPATAAKRIEEILVDFPNSDFAWALKVRHVPNHMSFDQIEATVPIHIRGMPETQFALSVRAKQSNQLSRAEEYARKLLKSEASSIPVQLTLVEILLQQVRQYAVESGIDSPPITHDALQEIDGLLLDLSRRVPPTSRASYSLLRFFQGISCHLQAKFLLASKHFHAACEACDDPYYVLQHAILLHDMRNEDGAIELLEGVTNDASPRTATMLSSMLLSRNKSGDRERARDILSIAATGSLDSDDSAFKCVHLLSASHLLDKRPDDALAVLTQYRDLLTTDAYFALRASCLRSAGRTEEAKREIQKVTNVDGSHLVKRTVAEELLALEMWDAAFEAWKGLATPTSASEATMSVLRAAYFAHEDDFILSFCEDLRKNDVFATDFFHLEVNKQIEYNAVDAATAAMTSYIDRDPKSDLAKELRARLSNLYLLSESKEHLTFDRSLLPGPTEAHSDLGLCVVSVLVHGPNPLAAVEYSYQLLRANFDAANAHKAMIISIVKSPKTLKLPESSVAAPGFAVKYQDDQGGNVRWHIIEDEDDPDASRDEYSVDHPISKALLGKRIGDKFTLRNDQVQQKSGTVIDIWSKYKLRFNACMEEWETRFADDDGFLWRFTAPPDGTATHSAFAPFERREKYIGECQELYKTSPMSMIHFAERTGMNTVESIWHLASVGLPIRCSTGLAYEANSGLGVVSERRKAILDSSAVGTLIATGLATELDSKDVELYISHGTLYELREMLAELKDSSGNRLVKDGDNYLIITVSDEQRAADIKRIATCIDAIESNCKTKDGRALARLPREQRESLRGCLPASVAETLAICQEEHLVLWSDDQAVSDIGRYILKVYDRIWSDAMFHWQSLQRGDGRFRHKASARLAQFNYHFTQLTPQGVLLVCEECNWNTAHPDLSRLLSWFSIGEHDSRIMTVSAAKTMLHLWTNTTEFTAAEVVLSCILGNIKGRSDSSLILRALPNELTRVCGTDVIAARKLRKLAIGFVA
jgi:tetratricopeptide (TPR) repeat protein